MSAICDAHKKVGVELLYNSVHRKFNQLETRCGRESQHPAERTLRPPINQFGDQMGWRQDAVEKASTQHPAEGAIKPRLSSLETRPVGRRCWIEEHVPERLCPQAPGWAAQENGKETRLWPIEWGSICCSSVWSPTPSHTQPFQIKWEVYFSKNCVTSLYCVVVMILHAYVDVYVLCVCIVGHGYTTEPLNLGLATILQEGKLWIQTC